MIEFRDPQVQPNNTSRILSATIATAGLLLLGFSVVTLAGVETVAKSLRVLAAIAALIGTTGAFWVMFRYGWNSGAPWGSKTQQVLAVAKAIFTAGFIAALFLLLIAYLLTAIAHTLRIGSWPQLPPDFLQAMKVLVVIFSIPAAFIIAALRGK